jgi:hypothetical protein
MSASSLRSRNQITDQGNLFQKIARFCRDSHLTGSQSRGKLVDFSILPSNPESYEDSITMYPTTAAQNSDFKRRV